jgi:D-arabinose 1-dehydrogenase-like Zn-dependent alcohol dehydrogenase
MSAASEQPGDYRAAVVHQFREPLTIDRVPARELAHGQVRVKVEASGLCHTDISRRAWGVAGEAGPTVHAWPRGRRDRHRAWSRSDRGGRR